MEFLCLEVVNSDHVDWRSSKTQRDMLDDESWLLSLSGKWGFSLDAPIDPNLLTALKELRAEMRSIVTKLSKGEEFQQADLSGINKVLEQVCLKSRLVPKENGFSLEHSYDAEGWQLVLWQVARSFSELLEGQELSRIKICDNEDCSWAFYDESKNRARRWCDDKVCGNIMKVRRFRSRQKAQERSVAKE